MEKEGLELSEEGKQGRGRLKKSIWETDVGSGPGHVHDTGGGETTEGQAGGKEGEKFLKDWSASHAGETA